MASLRSLLLGILFISFLTFVALFGRLPVLRKTPIGLLHHVVWIHAPRFLVLLDSAVTGGRCGRYARRTKNYLFHENHPLVLIFFVLLLSACETLFVPAAWSRLALRDKIAAPIVIFVPYFFLYKCVVSSSMITRENHSLYMQMYPYDKIIFHPRRMCPTCQFLKPARSKHCSLCKGCVARHDHHCIWLRTCVGRNNYRFFLGLLLSVSILLVYGACLGYDILYRRLQEEKGGSTPWSKDLEWLTYLELLGYAISDDLRIGTVAFFAMLTAPLSSAMLLYHIYLIWAGMTTNESAKWGDWRDDISNGIVYAAKASQIYPPREDDYLAEPCTSWPVTGDQTLVFTEGGEPPKVGSLLTMDRMSIIQPDNAEDAASDPRWVRIKSMKEIKNIYDLGFWSNLRDSLGLLKV
ncbi:hypothetical protein VTO42DRAFT_8265 [Malbranchea cinnamomea]